MSAAQRRNGEGILSGRSPLPQPTWLPMCRADMERLGWDALDVLLISGDAYVDHPSFGVPLLGRWLVAHGFRVGVVAQPRWTETGTGPEVTCMGRPELFAGVSAGALDSMLAHYTAFRKKRHDDAYTPGGKAGARPNRAVIVYAGLVRRAFPGLPVLAGGIEASLRRLTHFDFWSDALRRSILFDARLDLLVCGMGERALLEAACRADALRESIGPDARWWPSDWLADIPGTGRIVPLAQVREAPEEDAGTGPDASNAPDAAEAANAPEAIDAPDTAEVFAARAGAGLGAKTGEGLGARSETGIRAAEGTRAGAGTDAPDCLVLASHEAMLAEPASLLHASLLLERETHQARRSLAQPCGDKAVLLTPPASPLSGPELDALYALPFTRRAHPSYAAPVPAALMIADSLTTHRGCGGGCSFCSLALHQGRRIASRSRASVLDEAARVAALPGFKGALSDVGGPSANMWQTRCIFDPARCRRVSCLFPTPCKGFAADQTACVELLRAVRELPGIRHVRVASGVRFDMALADPEALSAYAAEFTGGQLKIAPEHCVPRVLDLMRKPGLTFFEAFMDAFARICQQEGKEQYVIPYLMSGFPGCTDEDMRALAAWLRARHWSPRQVQCFIPTPGTVATAMFYAGLDPDGRPIPVARSDAARLRQHAILLGESDGGDEGRAGRGQRRDQMRGQMREKTRGQTPEQVRGRGGTRPTETSAERPSPDRRSGQDAARSGERSDSRSGERADPRSGQRSDPRLGRADGPRSGRGKADQDARPETPRPDRQGRDPQKTGRPERPDRSDRTERSDRSRPQKDRIDSPRGGKARPARSR